jgi:hypothetical protein
MNGIPSPSPLDNRISLENTFINKTIQDKPTKIRFHSKRHYTITKMNDNINMDTAWTWTQHKHGYSMDTAWKQHGHSMDTTWTQHGHSMDMDTT